MCAVVVKYWVAFVSVGDATEAGWGGSAGLGGVEWNPDVIVRDAWVKSIDIVIQVDVSAQSKHTNVHILVCLCV